MVPLDIQKARKELLESMDKAELSHIRTLMHAADTAIPDKSRHGPIFTVGEIVWLRGGKFEIAEITTDGIKLKGLPSK